MERYQIVLQGHLDQRWRELFLGMDICCDADGTTRLTGELADQTALHGVLSNIRDLGVPLICVQKQV